MAKFDINELVPKARSLIDSYIDNLDETVTMPPDNLDEAGAAFTRLQELYDDFLNKIERFGALRPHIHFAGCLWLIQLRCFGSAANPDNCGLWFMKVSVLYCVTMAADVDLE
jgi:hypothetical protein